MKQFLSWLSAILVTTILAACGGDNRGADISPAINTTHALGGTVSGLGDASGLQLTDGIDKLSIDASASTFSFPTLLTTGTGYAVSIAAQPVDKICSVAGGTGTIGSADVANVVVSCADHAFHIGGTVQGLSGPGLVLTNDADTLAVDAGAATFTMPALVAFGGNYAVTVQSQPVGQACSVNNGAGVMSATDVTAISVICNEESFALGGSITGLGNNSGLVLANGSDTLSIDADATRFTMPTRIPYASAYSVTIQSSPAEMTCTVTQGSGSMPASNVVNVAVTCATDAYTISGTISGLPVPGLVLANGSDRLSIPANATDFTMPAAVAFTSTYAVAVVTPPTNYTCTVGNGAGTMGAGPVTDITVTCARPAFTLGGSISALASNGLILSNGNDTLPVLANATTFSMPTAVATGASYDISVVSNPAAVRCTVSNASGVMGNEPMLNASVSCVPATVSTLYSFKGYPDGALPQSSALLQGKDGSLYGTTPSGGANNAGMVFRITPAGEQTALWQFGSPGDGSSPYSSLIQGSDGNFYGTTAGGGESNHGTVFMVTPKGEETVLWSFRAGTNDGESPVGGLLQGHDGNFYGVTSLGGPEDAGTVFRLTPSGTETLVISFLKSNFGGWGPDSGGLIQDADGDLFGTVALDGGALYELSIQDANMLMTWWPFDSMLPIGNPIQATDGNFYGATIKGGQYGRGIIYKLTPAGSRTPLYSFGADPSDGSSPAGTLIQGNDGALYGLTSEGGAAGAGTLFRLTLDGRESVVHSFLDTPAFGLTQGSDGTLYGMTHKGGSSGLGTVFQLK